MQTKAVNDTESARPSPADLIDLARYPILNLISDATRELTRQSRDQLDRSGACELPGFLKPEAVAMLVREADSLASHAYHSVVTGTPYLEVPDPSWPSDHPRKFFEPTSVGVVAYDRFPHDSAMRQLFEWDPLMEFIAAALKKDRLYRYADPMGALNLAVMGEGERLHWHYDQTDFVTSIALRPSEAGGDFEYVPLIRSVGNENENYPRVQRLLEGSGEGVVRVAMHPGTLLLFEGRNSIHRVTPISGRTTRLVALLAYDSSSAAPPATRIEKDLLGARAVPADALYGIQTVRALENLSFSGRSLANFPDYIRALATVKKAAARANRDAHVLDARRHGAIERACDALIRGEHLAQFPIDMLAGGGSIAVNMNVNEVIANLANEYLGAARGTYQPVHPKLHVNASQSTADVCHTAIRMTVLARWSGLRRVLARSVGAFRAKAVQLWPVITISRTCLQDASRVSLGELFGAHAEAIERRAGELGRSVRALARINLGGTAIGSGSGASATYRRAIVKRLNELGGTKLTLRRNLYDAAQNMDDLAEVSAQLAMLAEVLIKIAQDLRLLASGPAGGFGEIILPAVQEGSSIFPGKINPAIPETMLQCCFQVLGCERATRLALERGELNLNVFEGAAAANVFDEIEMMRRSIALFVERCVTGIVANKRRCRELAARARY
ncbi:MAG: HalD/BesD family halogenase [Candidatus Binatus sp.]